MRPQWECCSQSDKDNNWYKLILSAWADIDPGIRGIFFKNFILNENYIGWLMQEKKGKLYDCNVPWAILMSPLRL